MKQALAPDGNLIEATARAPRQARCPHCGGLVTLRGRGHMSGDGVTYFWRHRDNSSLTCPGRKRPIAFVGEHRTGSRTPKRGQ
jgi:hypothetical protein